jgi:hypothetical protein
MNATGKRRLLKLADFLEGGSIPRGKFNMKIVASDVENGRLACGSSACACGWASIIPSFRRAGYRLSEDGAVSLYAGHLGWDAVAAFFDISPDDADDTLFGQHFPNSRKACAQRIRKFVARQEATEAKQ